MSDIAPLGVLVFERLTGFFNRLREVGFEVPTGRVLDAVASVRSVTITDEDEFRVALRANLARSRGEQRLFDLVFGQYWLGEEPETPELLEAIEEHARGRAVGDDESELAISESYSSASTAARPDLEEAWLRFDAELRTAIAVLKRKMRSRSSRREVPSARGRRLDLRRTLRASARQCFELVELARMSKKRSRTRFLCLVDVSGSMHDYNRFLLQVMLAIQRAVSGSRTMVFSTDSTEITNALRRRRESQVLPMIDDMVDHWSSGTRIGAALAHANRLIGGASRGSLVCVIVSDGFDQGDVEEIERQMARLQRHVRSIVWVNPLLGTDGYRPLARGMQAALPYIDHFLAANDAPSMLRVVRKLATV